MLARLWQHSIPASCLLSVMGKWFITKTFRWWGGIKAIGEIIHILIHTLNKQTVESDYWDSNLGFPACCI